MCPQSSAVCAQASSTISKDDLSKCANISLDGVIGYLEAYIASELLLTPSKLNRFTETFVWDLEQDALSKLLGQCQKHPDLKTYEKHVLKDITVKHQESAEENEWSFGCNDENLQEDLQEFLFWLVEKTAKTRFPKDTSLDVEDSDDDMSELLDTDSESVKMYPPPPDPSTYPNIKNILQSAAEAPDSI